jgi:hypothetical protein
MAQPDEADEGAISSVLNGPPAVTPALPVLTEAIRELNGLLQGFRATAQKRPTSGSALIRANDARS